MAASSNCSAEAIAVLVQEEEARALQRATEKAYILHQATSPTISSTSASTSGIHIDPSQLKVDIDIFDAMKCTIGAVTAEINRRNESMSGSNK